MAEPEAMNAQAKIEKQNMELVKRDAEGKMGFDSLGFMQQLGMELKSKKE